MVMPTSTDAPQRGWTFLEMMVVGSILGVFTLTVLQFLSSESDFWETSITRNDVRAALNHATTRMVTELRNATRTAATDPPNASIPADPNNTQMQFYLPADQDGNGLIIDAIGNLEWDMVNAVQFVYDLPTQQLRRVQDANVEVLATGVTAVTFDDVTIDNTLRPDEVRVTLTVQRQTPRQRVLAETLTSIIQLRN